MNEIAPNQSLFEEPLDGPFCEEQEVKAIRPELENSVLTYVPEAIPAAPVMPLQPTPQPDCGCHKASNIPVPGPAVPGTLPPEAPLPPDSPYIYVENEFGELAAMWLHTEPPLDSEQPLEEDLATIAVPEPLPSDVATEEMPLPAEPEAPAPVEAAPVSVAEEPVAPIEAPAPINPQPAMPEKPAPVQPEAETFTSPFKVAEYPAIKPQFRTEPKPEASFTVKSEQQPATTGIPRPREVWRMS